MRNTDSIKDSEETIAEDSIKENVVSKNKENTETELKQTEDFAVETNKDDKSENNDIVSNEKLSIVTTIFPQYDFTKQIVGDKADVTMLLKPGLESHSYEPTPQDIKTIQSSDLFIYTGGENDTWIYGIIESMGDSAPETMKLIDLVNTVEEEIVEGMQHDHGNDRDYVEYADYEEEHDHAEHEESEEDYKDREKDDHKHVHEVDEHVWTSPINAIK
ncbi:MAG: zinc ABC transporter substrate-binding protein, partial [Clostridiaceae bacterium]|nr:zinc ABC transporter substrate-binding protein [Clostridiaceae bacterium]